MAKEKKKAAAEAPAYEMPAVEQGEVVLWHDSPESGPTCMALVTTVASDTISLSWLAPGYHNVMPLDGVRHIDHPDSSLVKASEVGVWSHRPGHLALLKAVGSLQERVEALETGLGQVPDPGNRA